MARIEKTDILDEKWHERFGFRESVDMYDYGNYSTVTDFERVLEQSVPMTSHLSNESLKLYTEKGYTDPEEQSPSQILDEGIKSLLQFKEVMTKQMGLLCTEFLNKQVDKGGDLVQLVTLAVNAILGVATQGFSFNVFSLIGSVLSAAGFSNIGSLINSLGSAKDNWKKVQEEEQKVAIEVGKNVTAAVKATNQVMDNPEGNNVTITNVQQTDSNVVNTKANVSINEQTPLKSVAAGTYIQTSTDHILTANYYKANHTHYSVQADNSYMITTRHSTRYHTASVVEIAAEADYIASSLSSYADFRWTQTGQSLVSLPIANQLSGLIGQLFKTGSIPITGVNIDLSTFAKLTSASLFNINYGQVYTIDGFVLINSGVGAGLASIPPRSVSNIRDIPTPNTVDKPKPESFVSVNNKTYETIYQNNDKFEGLNLGQIFTNIEDMSNDLKEQTTQPIDNTNIQTNSVTD